VDDATCRDRLLAMTRRIYLPSSRERLSLLADFQINNVRYVVASRKPQFLAWPFLAKSFSNALNKTLGRTRKDEKPSPKPGPEPVDPSPRDLDSELLLDRGRREIRTWLRQWLLSHVAGDDHGGNLDSDCPECVRYQAFCRYFFRDETHETISAALNISVELSRLYRAQAIQRLKHYLTRYPVRLEPSSRGWVVVMNDAAYWPQIVTVACSPDELGQPSTPAVSIPTGRARAETPITLTLTPPASTRPTDIVFDAPSKAGEIANGVVFINQVRLEATARLTSARTWVRISPSTPQVDSWPLTIEALDQCGGLTASGVNAPSHVTIDIPAQSNAVPVQVSLVGSRPVPTAIVVDPGRVTGGSPATVFVTSGIRLRARGGHAAVTGYVAVVPAARPLTRFALSIADPKHVKVRPESVAMRQATGTSDARTRPVARDTPVAISASRLDLAVAATLILTPPEVVEVRLPPTIGTGQTVSGTVHLSQAAAEDTVISFLIKNTRGLHPPRPVVVPHGKRVAEFELTAVDGALGAHPTVVASDGRSQEQTRIEIVANSIKAITFSPPRVVGGTAVTATVQFAYPVHEDGFVDLRTTLHVARFDGAEGWDAKPLATRVPVPAKGAAVTVEIATARVAREQSVELVAEWNHSRESGKFRITPSKAEPQTR
jgi:hypothetical protein